MARAVPSLFLAALAVLSPAPAHGADTRTASEPLPTASRVTAVVIYRQHALVTREAEVVLEAGERRVPMNDDTTAALPPDPREPGILRREIPIPVSARADVTLRYRVRAPIGMPPVEP